MAGKTSEIAFFREGLSHYPDARETVDYFENCVQEAISAAFDAKTTWKRFQPVRDSGGSLQKAKLTGPVDRYISVNIAGTLPSRNGDTDKVWIVLGLCWNPRCRPARTVAYCYGASEKSTSVPLLDLPVRDRRLVIGPLNRKTERRLLLDADDDFDPDEAFPLLLDSLDDAMGVVETGYGTPDGTR